ncbi:MAG: hypothetical protein JW715_09360 [Sedimentisphaerales bacterium]|nr:hypothetical protein [Sedimentisphaerales bacterium]
MERLKFIDVAPKKDLVGVYKILDLSNCTRIEVKYDPALLEHRSLSREKQCDVFNPEEIEYVNSETFVVDSPELIQAYAKQLSMAKHRSTGGGIGRMPLADLICYNNDELIVSFVDYGNLILYNVERHWFEFENRSMFTTDLIPKLSLLTLRGRCARGLLTLRSRADLFERGQRDYPNPSRWCDDVVQAKSSRWLQCPSAGEGKCHYAMNPNCGPDSPGDMVLLFETKAGWNQHGGPELFTFDNHNPRGGCVLLNDGTVKFIRTEQELKNLRWK